MSRKRSGFWTKKEALATGLSAVTQGPRGFSVYYKGTNEDDATYVGSIHHVSRDPCGIFPKDAVDKTIFSCRYSVFSEATATTIEKNVRLKKRWNSPDEALPEVLVWCRANENLFKEPEE